jgi:hypothetical protein
MQLWDQQADQFQGLVLRFDPVGTLSEPHQVEYSAQRPHLTTVREQVNDLVGIQRATVIDKFQSKLLTKAKHLAYQREWRCIQVMKEEDLDCGEDIEDWYMDEPVPADSLRAIYIGFRMPEARIKKIAELADRHFPGATLYLSTPVEEQFDLSFEKLNCETISATS